MAPDTSAIVPLLVIEPSTESARSILTGDEDERQARQVLQQLADVWSEVQPSELLRGIAERLLAVHPLREADALQ